MGFINRQFSRVKWIMNNYRFLGGNSKLLSGHFLGPITYDTDSLCTSNNCDFINESKFNQAYLKAAATNPWSGFTLQWRVYVVCWFANHVKHLEGDFVECGVNTGAYSRAVIDYIDFQKLDKKFYLLDTFSGLVADQITESERKNGIDSYLGKYQDVYQDVIETFKNFNVKVIKGMVPDTLDQCDTSKLAYLSIDMNCVEPEIKAMEYFWDKVVSGGVIILDDYGFYKHIDQKLAFDAFAKEKKVEILCLPTGQGIILKQ